MKFLILNFLFVFTLGNANAYVLPSANENPIFAEAEFFGPVIIMVDEVLMRVNTGNSSITVNDIEIFDQAENLVLQVSGCNLEECIVEVSALSAGTYDVTVTTSTGSTFSGTITLG